MLVVYNVFGQQVEEMPDNINAILDTAEKRIAPDGTVWNATSGFSTVSPSPTTLLCLS